MPSVPRLPAPNPPRAARRPALRSWRVSPGAFRTMAAVAVWALAATIISGAAVRLTGSGLGCPDWPACTATDVVAPLQFHAWVEFGNRLINAAVSIAAVGAVVAAWLRAPRRRDLTLLSVGLLIGLLAEVVLGGLTVEHKLAPGFVMAHFLLAMVFLGDAVVLHHRASQPDGPPAGRPVARVGPVALWLARLLVVVTAAVITLGTVVTSTGPHGGDPDARRFGFSLHAVAQLHGTSVEILLAVTLFTMWTLARTAAPRPVIRRAEVLLVTLVAQAAVGYTQYFNGDPVGVVALHVAGATAVAIAVLYFYLGLFTLPSPAEPEPVLPAADTTPVPEVPAGLSSP